MTLRRYSRRGWRLGAIGLVSIVMLVAAPAWAFPASFGPMTDAQQREVLAQIDGVGRRGFLYEVSRSPATGTAERSASPGRLFLYGTIHLGRSGSEPFNAPVLRALRTSGRVALEADPTDMEDTRRLAMELGTYPDGDGLERHLPPELMKRVLGFGARAGLPPDHVGRFRPWLLANMVTLSELGGAGLDPMLGSELYLSGFARGARLPIVEIEGVEAQLRVLAGLPDAMQTAQLDEALRDVDNSERRAEGEALFDLWLRGDREAGEVLVARLHREAEGRVFERYFVDRLIDRRNGTMADKAEQYLSGGGNTFFAVGSLHLFGEAGLIREFERRGYRVVDLQAPPGRR